MNTEQLLKQYHDKIVKTGNFQTHRITNHIADIFSGMGWEGCSRYRFRKDQGRWEHVFGPKLSVSDLKEALHV